MLGVAPLEHVEVDPVQDGDAVVARCVIGVELLHGCPDLSRVDQLPGAGLAGLGEQDEADPGRGALLVALDRVEDGVDVDRRIEPVGSPWRARIASTSSRSSGASESRSAASRPSAIASPWR